jgi:hypothetical protein
MDTAMDMEIDTATDMAIMEKKDMDMDITKNKPQFKEKISKY